MFVERLSTNSQHHRRTGTSRFPSAQVSASARPPIRKPRPRHTEQEMAVADEANGEGSAAANDTDARDGTDESPA